MGFHIVNLNNGVVEHEYIRTEKELAFSDKIKGDTIIYQGEENWKPVRVGDSEKYKDYCNLDFRAGMKAQQLFKEQARRESLMLEEINQDVDSFANYKLDKTSTCYKRVDFLVRNYRNLEIEVKCKRFYPDKNPKVFYFNVQDLLKHTNMQESSQTPIILAIYERSKDGGIIEEPNFVSIDMINKNKNKLKIEPKNNEDCYKIPISYLKKGFGFIKEFSW